jgi:nucleoside-diphosphate-sugar epimerase
MVKLQAKKLLVTGGAGFLGSHVCERLLAAGHDALYVDNFFPDIALARSKLGWGPTTELAEGLGRTIRYFQQAL